MLRRTIRRFIADRVLPFGGRLGGAGLSCRARLCARWARSACSACATRPNTAARASIRSPTPCWRRSSAAPPTAASPSPCWCTPTWPRRISITPAAQSSCERWMPDITAGRKITAVAMTEADAGSDLASMRTTARKVAGGYVLNGAKMFITNGVHGDLYFVAAKTGDAGRNRTITMFAVEKGTPGFRSPARSRSTAGSPATRPSWCSRTASCRRRTCWARKARASTRWSRTCRTSASCSPRRRWARP